MIPLPVQHIFALQLTAILLAVAYAAHDCKPVDNFNHYGVLGKNDLRVFHYSHFIMKAFTVSIAVYIHWKIAVAMGLWIWLLFDPILNKMRKIKKPFFYLSTNTLDAMWKIFGNKGGVVKFCFLLACIVAWNILLLFRR